MKNKAFTLIELLVVIAIVGLLIALSMVALESYRNKARDARIEGTLVQVRSVATFIKSDSGAYFSVCKNGTLNDEDVGENYQRLSKIENDVKRLNGGVDVACNSTEDTYCVSTALIAEDAYCVDSSGYAGEDKSACNALGICE